MQQTEESKVNEKMSNNRRRRKVNRKKKNWKQKGT